MKAPKHATTNYRAILPFIQAVEASEGQHIKLEAGGFEPLTMENLQYRDYKGRPVYSIAHWYEQNGDLCCDPDMTFSVDHEAKTIWPLTYQMDCFGQYQQAFKRQADGKMTYSPYYLRELDEFLWQWLKNLEMQGFRKELEKCAI